MERLISIASTTAALAIVQAFVGGRVASAQEPPPDGLSIEWSGEAGCSSEADLRREIRRSQRDPDHGSKAVRVQAEVARAADGTFVLRLALIDATGQAHRREIDGDTCEAVVGAAAVAVALAIESESDAPTADAAPSSPASPSAPLVSPRPTPVAAPTPWWPAPRADTPRIEPAPGGPRRIEWDLEAFGGADFASLPQPSPGFGLALTSEVKRNRFIAGAAAWLPSRADLASRPSAGAHVGLYALRAEYGRSLLRGTFDLVPRAGIEVGAMVGQGAGLKTAKLGASPWVAPSLSIEGLFRVSRAFAISLEADGLLPLVRPNFQITSGGQVYKPPPVTARAVLGVEARFL